MEYDVARNQGLRAAVGQLEKENLIPEGIVDKEGSVISVWKTSEGEKFASDQVDDAELFQDELCELVAQEFDNFKYNSGGPYLPNYVPEALMRHVLVPLEDFEAHNRAWLSLPGPVKNYASDADLYEICPAFIDKKRQENEAKRTTEASGTEQAGPSQTQESEPSRRRSK